jgi:Zn-dependent peptidase ImmA (M78 family)
LLRRPAIPHSYVESVRNAARQLLQRAGVTTPPVAVEDLARLQDVLDIRESNMGTTDAHLTPSARGFIIEVNAFVSPARRRFSIAHEIAHTFFNPVNRSYRRSVGAVTVARERPDSLVEEALCDIAAAEMLMPEDLFRAASRRKPPSIDVIGRLAALFETSIEATALRYGSLGPESTQVTAWKRNYAHIRAKWNKGARVLRPEPFRLREAHTFVKWCLAKAYFTRELVRGHDVELSCYPPKRIWIQAQGFRQGSERYVLSLMQSAYSEGGEF